VVRYKSASRIQFVLIALGANLEAGAAAPRLADILREVAVEDFRPHSALVSTFERSSQLPDYNSPSAIVGCRFDFLVEVENEL
jgi:hypothetical protein